MEKLISYLAKYDSFMAQREAWLEEPLTPKEKFKGRLFLLTGFFLGSGFGFSLAFLVLK